MGESELNQPGPETPAEALPTISAVFRPTVLLPFALLLTAFAFGGAAAGQPLRDLAVALVAIVVLAASVFGCIGRPVAANARMPLILIGALTLLFLLQLIPLPFGIWSSLAGRELSASVLTLIGAPSGPRPMSVDPELTVLAALAVLPGLAMALAVMRMTASQRMVLVWATVALALASLLFGVLQISFGAQAGRVTLYTNAHIGQPVGVFANINHQADMLAVAFVFAGIFAQPLREVIRCRQVDSMWVYGVMITLAVGVVVCGSRSGIALIGIGLIAIALRERLAGHTRTLVIGGALVVGLLTILVLYNPIFARSFADFSNTDDGRFHFWPNVTYAISQFGWTGTGAGSFDGVYRSVETLDTLSPRYLNHAHNDFLEILLEMGIPGTLLFGGFLALLVMRAIRRPIEGIEGRLAYAGLACTTLLLLHSMVDYPLRTPLLSVLFGLCSALLVATPAADMPRAVARGAAAWIGRAVVIVCGCWLGYVAAVYGLADSALIAGDAKTALRIRPNSTDALSLAAAQALEGNDPASAERYARAALIRSPRDVRALRVLGIVASADGRRELGSRLLLTSGALGWRDAVTQVWLIRAALADNNFATATQRIDAMLRSEQLFDDMMKLAHNIARNPAARPEMVERLVEEPRWRRQFFKDMKRIAPEDEPGHLLLIEALIQREGSARRGEVVPFIDHLVRNGKYELAMRLWLATRASTVGEARGTVFDGVFKEDGLAEDQQPRYAFEWQFETNGNGNAAPGIPPLLVGDNALFVQAVVPNIRLARQLLLLPVGARRLTYDVLESDNSAPERFRWHLVCVGGPEVKLGPVRTESVGQRRILTQDFVVPANCRAQYLELRSSAAPSTATAEAWLDNVAVK